MQRVACWPESESSYSYSDSDEECEDFARHCLGIAIRLQLALLPPGFPRDMLAAPALRAAAPPPAPYTSAPASYRYNAPRPTRTLLALSLPPTYLVTDTRYQGAGRPRSGACTATCAPVSRRRLRTQGWLQTRPDSAARCRASRYLRGSGTRPYVRGHRPKRPCAGDSARRTGMAPRQRASETRPKGCCITHSLPDAHGNQIMLLAHLGAH